MIQKKNVSTLVFIDSNVEDYQSLINGVSPNAEVIILDEKLNGIEQITERLATKQNIEAIHIISHGSPGSVQLGANTLNSSNIESFGPGLQQWRKALIPGADILLYGCNVAADVSVTTDISYIRHISQELTPLSLSLSRLKPTPDNLDNSLMESSLDDFGYQAGVKTNGGSDVKLKKPNQFLDRLSELTGADIAASANPTGNAALGGDWELEVQIGRIEATPIKALAYSGILAASANPDNKAIPVNSPQITIDTLANDTGSSRVSVQSITTAPTNGTATINDWIYAGGNFTTVNGTARNRIARINADGSLDTAFNPSSGMNSNVEAIAIDSSGKLYVGGFFTTVNGTGRNRIARMDPDGSLDNAFNPNGGMNGTVYPIALDSSGKLYAAGGFSTVNGTPRNYIARMNPDGSLDAAFNPSFNAGVVEIALDEKRNIFYTPNAGFNGTDTFQYTATDGTASTPTTVTVLVNDSPALDNTGSPTLNPQNQDDSASPGTLISTITANLGGTQITDPNLNALQGIAITNLDTASGTWQYTTDGTTWNNAPAVSAANALLLASDANTSLRFVPNAGYNGTVTNAITFVAWDRITGTNGGVANYTTDRTDNTTSSVFSSATETADIAITPLPTVTSVSAATADGTYGIGRAIDITVNFSQSVNVTGTPQLSLAGVTPVANYLSGSGSNTLTFRYEVVAGDISPDLDYVSTTALSLSGGTIKNATNGDAILTLVTPGAVNSLGDSKDIVIDSIAPTVTLTSAPATTVNAAFSVTATFSENVAGFDNFDITVTNATVSNFVPVDAKTYSFDVTPSADGNVTVDVPGATATDTAGNNNTAAAALTRTADFTPPTVALTSASPTTVNAAFSVTATFSENVTEFDNNNITVTNATVGNFVTVDAKTYTFDVTPNADAAVTVDVFAAVATDTATNNNTAATQLVRTADVTPPTVALTSTSPTTINAPFLVTATFSENVTGFVLSDINVTNGTVSDFTGSGTNYNFTVTPNADSPVTVDVLAAVANDTASNNNTAATQLIRNAANITAPPASLGVISNIDNSGDTSQILTGNFSDINGIDVSSLDDSDLVVNWSGGAIPTAFVGVDTNSNSTTGTATYLLTPPGEVGMIQIMAVTLLICKHRK